MNHQISYAMSEGEVLRASLEQIWWQHRRAWKTTAVLYGIVTGAAIKQWTYNPTLEFGLELLVWIGGVVAAYLIFTLLRIRRSYHQHGHLGRKYLVTLTTDGLTFEVDFDALTLTWGTFTGFAETGHFLLLAHRTGGAFALPKRAFRTRQQIDEWLVRFKHSIAQA